MHHTTDPVWESLYSQGHRQHYPWDCVVSFVYRHAPRDIPRNQVDVMEIGFGSGSNLWFAAREGFRVSGIDGSETAVNATLTRFAEEGLTGDLRHAEFPHLPFADNSFHLVVDRAATTCVPRQVCRDTILEVRRVLRPSGLYFLNTYSSDHSSASSGQLEENGTRVGITEGTLVDVGGICFYDESQIHEVIGSGWKILNLNHMVSEDQVNAGSRHAEWRVILEKQA